MKEWFDDLNEAQAWLTVLSIYCSEHSRDKVWAVLENISTANVETDAVLDRLLQWRASHSVDYNKITDCARKDLGHMVSPPRMPAPESPSLE